MNRAKQQMRQSIETAIALGNSPKVRYSTGIVAKHTGRVVSADRSGVVLVDDVTGKRVVRLWSAVARIEL